MTMKLTWALADTTDLNSDKAKSFLTDIKKSKFCSEIFSCFLSLKQDNIPLSILSIPLLTSDTSISQAEPTSSTLFLLELLHFLDEGGKEEQLEATVEKMSLIKILLALNSLEYLFLNLLHLYYNLLFS